MDHMQAAHADRGGRGIALVLHFMRDHERVGDASSPAVTRVGDVGAGHCLVDKQSPGNRRSAIEPAIRRCRANRRRWYH